jgi:2-polyprenyl-6-hydroxyphenyl methylase/3-demethylubiquinone-9 3-methyltransferase
MQVESSASKPQPATVNAAEVEKFSALAATWWDPQGPMWPLHKLNALRAPFIAQSIAAHLHHQPPAGELPLAGLSVLDIGCSAGLLSESMAALGARVTGIDPAAKNIAIAQQHASSMGYSINYLQGVAEDLIPQHFDVVLNMEVVEHVDALPLFMQQCCQLTHPGGMQFVATINRNLLSLVVAIFGAEYVLRWLPRGTHQWRKFVTPGELVAMLDEGGFSIVERRGVSVNPFTKGYRLTGHERVNYMLGAVRSSV